MQLLLTLLGMGGLDFFLRTGGVGQICHTPFIKSLRVPFFGAPLQIFVHVVGHRGIFRAKELMASRLQFFAL